MVERFSTRAEYAEMRAEYGDVQMGDQRRKVCATPEFARNGSESPPRISGEGTLAVRLSHPAVQKTGVPCVSLSVQPRVFICFSRACAAGKHSRERG